MSNVLPEMGGLPAWLVGLGVLPIGCAATSPLDQTGTRGLEPPTAGAPCERNFYPDEVVCYPARDIGPRIRGDQPGQRIENIKFFGYEAIDPNYAVDPLKGRGIVPLSEFYDPESRRLKLLVIVATDMQPGNLEIAALIDGGAQALAQNGVLTLVVLERTALGESTTLSDFVSWIGKAKPDFSVVMPAAELFSFQDSLSRTPFLLYVDARSMELLGSSQQVDSSFADAEKWVTWVNEHPPLSSP